MFQFSIKVFIGNTHPNHCLMMMGHCQNTFFLAVPEQLDPLKAVPIYPVPKYRRILCGGKILLFLRRERGEERVDKIVCLEQLSKSSRQMVKHQWIIFNCQTDQSQMSSIGSPTPLSGPKIDNKIIEWRLQWVDCLYTWRENGRRSNHTKYQQQPGRAYSAQSSVITQQGQNLKLKGWYCFLKRKNGVLSTTKFLRDLLPQRLNAAVELCILFCLTSYNWTCAHWRLSTRKMSDCIETNSVIGVDQLVEKKDLLLTCLGKWP
jgi:hypothetical protein